MIALPIGNIKYFTKRNVKGIKHKMTDTFPITPKSSKDDALWVYESTAPTTKKNKAIDKISFGFDNIFFISTNIIHKYQNNNIKVVVGMGVEPTRVLKLKGF